MNEWGGGGARPGLGLANTAIVVVFKIFRTRLQLWSSLCNSTVSFKLRADSFLSQLISTTTLETNVNFDHYCPDKVANFTLMRFLCKLLSEVSFYYFLCETYIQLIINYWAQVRHIANVHIHSITVSFKFPLVNLPEDGGTHLKYVLYYLTNYY